MRILFFIFSILLLFGCKKYEEDDRRYFKSPCGRIAKKWELYKITDRNGKDCADSTIRFTYWTGPSIAYTDSFTYNGMIIEFERSSNFFCGGTGIEGAVKCTNKPFSSGYYELKSKRTMFKLDIRPSDGSSTRYFLDDYKIHKMTSDELIFSNDQFKAYFKAAG